MNTKIAAFLIASLATSCRAQHYLYPTNMEASDDRKQVKQVRGPSHSNKDPQVHTTSTSFLAETLPSDIDLSLVKGGKHTWEAQVNLIKGAHHTLDVTVMYWDLLAHNDANICETTYTPKQFLAFGSAKGQHVFDAFKDAINRGVKIRFLNGKGISSDKNDEVATLKKLAKSPDQVQNMTWDAKDWYGDGIMHQKLWIADGSSVYLGSANMDWLSLCQVKELGVVVQDDTQLAADMTQLFERWWVWANPSTLACDDSSPRRVVSDPIFQVNRSVPCWSKLVPEATRCVSPLDTPENVGKYGEHHPMYLNLNGEVARTYVSGSPVEVLEGGIGDDGGSGPGRTWDLHALKSTILSAGTSVSLSVMDFIPSSLYTPPESTLWWGVLVDALLTAAMAKGVRVRMLVSKWAHTNARIAPYLSALQSMARACKTEAGSYAPSCTGSLEVKLFEMPGWNETCSNATQNAPYPAFSRVNHAKYIVTDKRVNIGTSNMAWSYFHNTAGASFNSNSTSLIVALQAVFDRDWDSPYAI